MTKNEIQIIELQAQKIFSELAGRKIPVPIEDVAEKLKIAISYAPSEEYSGMLIRREDQQTLMGVNSNEPKTRMRFTIAHEIGHFIFDKKNVSIDYRDTTKVQEKSPEEKRADYFASCLLMPKKELKLDFDQVPTNSFDKEKLVEFAKKYQVSQDAMKYRLLNLRLTH